MGTVINSVHKTGAVNLSAILMQDMKGQAEWIPYRPWVGGETVASRGGQNGVQSHGTSIRE